MTGEHRRKIQINVRMWAGMQIVTCQPTFRFKAASYHAAISMFSCRICQGLSALLELLSLTVYFLEQCRPLVLPQRVRLPVHNDDHGDDNRKDDARYHQRIRDCIR